MMDPGLAFRKPQEDLAYWEALDQRAGEDLRVSARIIPVLRGHLGALAVQRLVPVPRPERWQLVDAADCGYLVRRSRRGRKRIHLGKGHRFANSGGWQWLNRFLVMEALGVVLQSDEHVHHRNCNREDDRLENYEVLDVRYHGKLHALARLRTSLGTFAKSEGWVDWPRFGPVLGPAAKEFEHR